MQTMRGSEASTAITTTGLTRSRQQRSDSHWFLQLLALVILLLCAAIGMLGLILPLIPGFLFLALAAVLAARMFPALALRLRRYPGFSTLLDSSEGFLRLSLRDKCRYAAWFTLRALLEGARLLHVLLTSALVFVWSRPGD
jgi:uncharacterized membrane protein YbaN (DUF454 family)